jgi:hypothetical protein
MNRGVRLRFHLRDGMQPIHRDRRAVEVARNRRGPRPARRMRRRPSEENSMECIFILDQFLRSANVVGDDGLEPPTLSV